MARDRRPHDDDEEDERPQRRSRRDDKDDDEPHARRSRQDEDEGRPRRKVRARDDDENEDEDERPRKRQKPKPAGMSKGLLFGLIGGGVAIVAALLIIFVGGGSSPKSVMARVVKALQSRDFGTVYDNMSSATQRKIDNFAMSEVPGVSDPRQRFIDAMIKAEREGNGMPFETAGSVTILGETIRGDTATVQIRDHNGQNDEVEFIRENGRWKLSGLF